jgi:hypothetical protein
MNPKVVMEGIKSALDGVQGTFVYTRPDTNYYIVGWDTNNQKAIAVIDTGNKLLRDIRTLFAEKCPENADDLMKALEYHGWKLTPASAMTRALVMDLIKFGVFTGSSMVTVPVIVIMPTQLDPMEIINPKIGS